MSYVRYSFCTSFARHCTYCALESAPQCNCCLLIIALIIGAVMPIFAARGIAVCGTTAIIEVLEVARFCGGHSQKASSKRCRMPSTGLRPVFRRRVFLAAYSAYFHYKRRYMPPRARNMAYGRRIAIAECLQYHQVELSQGNDQKCLAVVLFVLRENVLNEERKQMTEVGGTCNLKRSIARLSMTGEGQFTVVR